MHRSSSCRSSQTAWLSTIPAVPDAPPAPSCDPMRNAADALRAWYGARPRGCRQEQRLCRALLPSEAGGTAPRKAAPAAEAEQALAEAAVAEREQAVATRRGQRGGDSELRGGGTGRQQGDGVGSEGMIARRAAEAR